MLVQTTMKRLRTATDRMRKKLLRAYEMKCWVWNHYCTWLVKLHCAAPEKMKWMCGTRSLGAHLNSRPIGRQHRTLLRDQNEQIFNWKLCWGGLSSHMLTHRNEIWWSPMSVSYSYAFSYDLLWATMTTEGQLYISSVRNTTCDIWSYMIYS